MFTSSNWNNHKYIILFNQGTNANKKKTPRWIFCARFKKLQCSYLDYLCDSRKFNYVCRSKQLTYIALRRTLYRRSVIVKTGTWNSGNQCLTDGYGKILRLVPVSDYVISLPSATWHVGWKTKPRKSYPIFNCVMRFKFTKWINKTLLLKIWITLKSFMGNNAIIFFFSRYRWTSKGT